MSYKNTPCLYNILVVQQGKERLMCVQNATLAAL